MATLGNKIRTLRKEKKLTLDRLATLTDSSKSYMWELENRDLPRPSAQKLSRIATVLNVSVEYLLDEHEQVSLINAVDAQFYRKYQVMDTKTKEKIRKMVEIWNEDEDE